MNYIKEYANFKNNRLIVKKGQYGWNCEYQCDLGTGKALILDNTSSVKNLPKMDNDEMYLFGIDTTPVNSGIGRQFLLAIFDHFKINRVYLPSSENHPVWNKIATKTDIVAHFGGKENAIFTLSRKQLEK